jgi:hypothetical protein
MLTVALLLKYKLRVTKSGMAEYYFDIETVPLEQYRNDEFAGLDPCKAKIITIQYQRLDSRTGKPLEPLHILKEWELGEKGIVEQFRQTYISNNLWHFISVGNNLAFESCFMKYKLKQYCGLEGLRLGHRPMIDLKHVLVLVNNGSFKGYQRFLGKIGLAKNMASWYYGRNYEAIENYINNEVRDFLRMYFVLKTVLPKIIAV